MENKLLNTFSDWACQRGLNERLFLVGGAVRDIFLGQEPVDVDLVYAGDALGLARDFAADKRARLILLREEFQNVRIIKGGEHLDLTGLAGASLEEDLSHRDFTVNAMALPLVYGKTLPAPIDPCGGKMDLEKRLVRMVSRENLRRDPLRLLRAYRFAGAPGFRLEKETEDAIRSKNGLISDTAGERVLSELKIIIGRTRAHPSIQGMADTGLLFSIFPELSSLSGVEQNRFHHLDVWEHTLLSFANMEEILSGPASLFGDCSGMEDYLRHPGRAFLLKFAALFHDAGKPGTRTVGKDGLIHFYGHEKTGADIIQDVGSRLRMSRKEIAFLQNIILNHLRVRQLLTGNPGRRGLTRLARDMGDDLYGLVALGLADLMAKAAPQGLERDVKSYLSFSKGLLALYRNEILPLMKEKRLISGHDIMRTFDVPQSPVLGEILEAVEQARLEGRISTRNEALKLAEQILQKGQ